MKKLFNIFTMFFILGVAPTFAQEGYVDPTEYGSDMSGDYPKYFSIRTHPGYSQGVIPTYIGFTCDDSHWSARGAEFLIEGAAEYYVSVLPGVMFGSKRTCKIISVRDDGIKKYIKIRGDEDCSLTVRYPRTREPIQEPNTVVYAFTKDEC